MLQFNKNRCCCRPVVTDVTPVCGVEVELDSNVYCTQVCRTVTFTVTITNNTSVTLNCLSLDLNPHCALCINPETITLNGTAVENANPSRIEIGTRFVADYELRELSKILKVSVNWLLGME